MRTVVALSLILLVVPGRAAHTQERRPDEAVASQRLPRAATQEVARLYHGPHALRVHERTEIAPGRVVDGNVSVIDGPLIVSGRINGRVLAINSDVLLRAGARIDGDLLVVGGDVEGASDAVVTGEIRVYRQALRFTRDGDRIVVEAPPADADEDSWWRRWERRRSSEARSRLLVASAGPYNRVEGLPVNVGPSIRLRRGATALRADAFAVFRTGSSFRDEGNDVGHHLGLEVGDGRSSGVRLGARTYDQIVPVESWQLDTLEYALSAFAFKRDYLDLYGRHGGTGYIELFDQEVGDATLSYSHERWSSRASVNPWTLFRQNEGWRENPAMDEGRLHILKGTLRLDTRNDDERPWAGWYVNADVERGTGDLERLGAAPPDVRSVTPGRVAYTRGFVDARRYNRVGPGAQLNFRLVAGGWLGGDALPLQRRLSVSGAGALPGFDFRTPIGSGADVGTCTAGGVAPGRPALCERIALAQVEYRGDLQFGLFGFDWRRDRIPFINDPAWVVFADAGRGWLIGEGRGDRLRYAGHELPPAATFRTDMGVGLHFGGVGLFAAKAISRGSEPLNFLVRLRHRF